MPRLPLGGNLVTNGDFEVPPSFTAAQTGNGYLDGTATGTSALSTNYGWHVAGNGTRAVQFDSVEKYSGTNSLKVTLSANSSYAEIRSNLCTTYNQAKGFIVQASTAYRATFYMKTTNMTGDATNGAYGVVLMSKADGTAGTTSSSTTAVKTNTDWTKYTITFTTASDDRFGHFEFRFYGHQGAATLQGTANIDEVQITPTATARTAV